MNTMFTTLLAAAAAKKPYKRRLSYIRAANNSQYINTGVIARSGLKTEIKFAINATSTVNNEILSAFDGTNRFFAPGAYNGQLQFGYGSAATIGSLGAYSVGIDYTVFCDFTVGSQSMSINGTTVYTGTNASAFDTNLPLFIMLRNQQGTPRTTAAALATVYYARIWDENDALLFDGIPVLDWDDVSCMYDNVTKALFYNIGTGTFSYA